jgi:glycosyltransferase involved in cell wall biosynthesis
MLLTNAYAPDPRVRQEALALIGMGCNVRILAWDRDIKAPAFECIEGVQIQRVFLRSRHGRGTTQILFYAWLYLKMLWAGLRTSFDVVHCHDLDTLPLGFAMGKLKRKPIVYDAHESFPDMLLGSVHPQVLAALVRLENFLIRRIDLLITVGEKLRQHFIGRGARQTTVVGNWKRLSEYVRSDEENREIRSTLGIPDDALLVLCITQLLKDRKLEELASALALTPEVHVVIGGTGHLEGQVRRWAADSPRLHYVGFVHPGNIPAYTCAADVVYYGFDPDNPNARFSAPNKLSEALAAGKPLITGDFGEIADVVRAASCGIVLRAYTAENIHHALSSLMNRPVRDALAANAKRFGQTFMNWEHGEQTLRREYSALLPSLAAHPRLRPAAQPKVP